jgi:hypothetical protein
MPEPLTPETSSSLPGFAELIASLAALKEPVPGDDRLADDVATLSYESALRTNGRYRAPAPANSHHGSVAPGGIDRNAGSSRPRTNANRRDAALLSVAGTSSGAGSGRERKCSSITVRMSVEECCQLRERATEAGLTVSAYLRSCAFEVESLRAQVKQTLVELRSANPSAKSAVASRSTMRRGIPQNWSFRTWFRPWFRRIWPTKRNSAHEFSEAVSA